MLLWQAEPLWVHKVSGPNAANGAIFLQVGRKWYPLPPLNMAYLTTSDGNATWMQLLGHDMSIFEGNSTKMAPYEERGPHHSEQLT